VAFLPWTATFWVVSKITEKYPPVTPLI